MQVEYIKYNNYIFRVLINILLHERIWENKQEGDFFFYY